MENAEEWTRVTPRRACSNRGYCVEILGLDGVAYIEGGSQEVLPSVALSTGGFAVRKARMQGTPERVAEILQRVQAGLEVMGSYITLDPPYADWRAIADGVQPEG